MKLTEKQKEVRRRYYKENRTEILEHQKNRRTAQKKHITQLGKTWRENNKDKTKRYGENHYKNHKDDYTTRSRRWRENNPERKILARLRAGAKKEHIPFNLELEDVKIPNICPVLGIALERGREAFKKLQCPSADRIVPKLGYVRGNVRFISLRANLIKSNRRLKN